MSDSYMTNLTGLFRTFYSTMQGIDSVGHYPAMYSGRMCRVIGPVPLTGNEDENTEGMWRCIFDDGAILHVFTGEINGYYFDTFQWHGPRGVDRRPGDKPLDYAFNMGRRLLLDTLA